MASDRQIAANRANAKSSTGPRSRNGKANSSRNAVRHGLASATRTDLTLADGVETLAKAISGSDAIPTEFAYQAASAELDLLRIREIGARVLDDVVGHPTASLADYNEAYLKLAKLQRYERLAFTRRRRAIRAIAQSRGTS